MNNAAFVFRTSSLAGFGYLATQVIRVSDFAKVVSSDIRRVSHINHCLQLIAMSSFQSESTDAALPVDSSTEILNAAFNVVNLLGLYLTILFIGGKKQSFLHHGIAGLGKIWNGSPNAGTIGRETETEIEIERID